MSNRSTSGPRSRRGKPTVALRSAAVALTVVVAGTACSRLGITTTTVTTVAPGHPTTTGSTVSVWGQPAPKGTGALEAVSCGDAQRCWAVGRSATNALTTSTTTLAATVVIDATTDGGVTWSIQQATVADPTDLAAIDCPDRLHCMAVGTTDDNGPIQGAVLGTADGGDSWRSMGAPAGSVDLSAVHCFTAADCTVLATDGSTYWSASTTDGGQVWQRGGSLPPGIEGISELACAGPEACVTDGYTSPVPGQGTGAVAFSDDGGATWAPATVPSGVGLLHGISCTPSLRCIAVGTESTTITDVAQGQEAVLSSTDGGQSWTSVDAASGLDDAFAVSCPSSGSCAAVGTVWTPTNPPTPIGGVVTTVDGGLTWNAPTTRYIPVGLTGVDCPTTTSCVAAGNDVLARIVLPVPPPVHRSKHATY